MTATLLFLMYLKIYLEKAEKKAYYAINLINHSMHPSGLGYLWYTVQNPVFSTESELPDSTHRKSLSSLPYGKFCWTQ
jgi:hypothetical protein